MAGLIERFFPGWALSRQVARVKLQQIDRLYNAAQGSNVRVSPPQSVSGNASVDHAQGKLRDWARHLDENHDMTKRALDIVSTQMTHQTVVPMMTDRSGIAIESLNRAVADQWTRWQKVADSTGEMHFTDLSELCGRSVARDGECFAVMLEGETPLSLKVKAFEADFVPFDAIPTDTQRAGIRTIHGVDVDDEDRRVRYWFYREHPEDTTSIRVLTQDLIPVPADITLHPRIVNRLGQIRGVSALASALTRIADISEYETSENAAAKVASAIAIQITRAPDFAPTDTINTDSGARQLELQPGMILDNLQAGEKMEVVDTSRPNPELTNFRASQLRAAAAGIGVSYSSMTRDYSGTYSSQRQELVESTNDYRKLQGYWRRVFIEPIYTRFVMALIRAVSEQPNAFPAALRFGRVQPMTLFDFDTIPPAMPWIDPQKEANANQIELEMRTESRHGLMRRRGLDPRRVDQEIEADDMAAAPTPEMQTDEQQATTQEPAEDADT